MEAERFVLDVVEPRREGKNLREDFSEGMLKSPKSIPPKYFYDEKGSELFDKICDTVEYYPTKTESRLLQEISPQLIKSVEPNRIIELGSGTARKTRHLFDACEALKCFPLYQPIDVCPEVLLSCKEELQQKYQWLSVEPLIGDYMNGFYDLKNSSDRNLFIFLGGTIGNFSETESIKFLRDIGKVMGREDSLLMGADLQKSPGVLHAAYNDSDGITAKFNLNLLNVLNKQLKGDFDLRNFEHHALYNPVASQIEMYLVCIRNQEVKIESLDETVCFHKGDCILTEISKKFTEESLERLVIEAGFRVRHHFRSNKPEFSLIHIEKK